jgi:hypothetical protein
VLVGVVATLLIAAAGLVAYGMDGDVPRGTRVLGVDLGGKSRTEAEQTLHQRFDRRAGDPVAIVLDGSRVSVAPAEIGLRLDVDATVGRAIRSRARLFGTHSVAPAVRLDPDRLEAVLRGRLAPAYPKAGLDLGLVQAGRAVRSVWLTGKAAHVELVERSSGPARGAR